MKNEKSDIWADMVEKIVDEEKHDETGNQEDATGLNELASLIKNNRGTIKMLHRHSESKAWQTLQPSLRKDTNILYLFMKYAAIIVVTFITGMYINNYYSAKETDGQFSQIDVPVGQMSSITLPDGTKVNLNSGSSLRYPAVFDKNKREVHFSGEAYFLVTENSKQPFLVHLDDYSIKVTGTEFNVQSYSHLPVQTVLVEGKVSILDKQGEELAKLNPSQMIQYSIEEKKYRLFNVDTEFYTLWKEGKLYVRNETFEEIAQKLERWYNVEIKYTDESIKNKRLTGTILKYKPFDQIIKILTLKETLEYEIKIRADKPDLVIISQKS